MITADTNRLLDDFETVLENQIDSARKGDLAAVERMTEDCAAMMKRIAAVSHLDNGPFASQWERIRKLHRQLVLMLAAEKESVGRQLKRVASGKKTITAYRDGVQAGGWSEKDR